MHARKARGEAMPAKESGLPAQAALGATHCGAGCTLDDIVAEPIVAALGLTLFGKGIFAAWALDYVLAFAFGIAFQYFTIAPMRGLGVRGDVAALPPSGCDLVHLRRDGEAVLRTPAGERMLPWRIRE